MRSCSVCAQIELPVLSLPLRPTRSLQSQTSVAWIKLVAAGRFLPLG